VRLRRHDAPRSVGQDFFSSPANPTDQLKLGRNDTISAGTGGKLAGPVAQALLNAALRVIP